MTGSNAASWSRAPQEGLHRLVHSEDFGKNLPRGYPCMCLRQVGGGAGHLGDGVVTGIRPGYPGHHVPGLIRGVRIAGSCRPGCCR